MTELLPFWFLGFVVTVFGLIIGSFLNVLIYRVPEKLSLLTPSACPNCQSEIRWLQNIPVASWLFLRGKCAKCYKPISIQYPLVEALTGLAFLGVLFWLGNPLNPQPPLAQHPIRFDAALSDGTVMLVKLIVLVALLYFVSISIVLTLIDLRTKRLPNVIVLSSVMVVIVLGALAGLVALDAEGFIRMILGLMIYFGSYMLIVFLHPQGMGMGDVKLAAVLGAYLGWQSWSALIVGWFVPFLLGGIWAIALMIFAKGNRKTEIPFGPWMLLGSWVGLLLGERIANGYLALIGLPII